MREITLPLAAVVSMCLTAVVMADEKDDKIRKARDEAQGLSAMVETYKLNNGEYPKSIKALAEPQPSGSPALVPKEKLKDPWGQLYEIDPKGKRSKGMKADVWSKGPPNSNPMMLIGNWREESPAEAVKAPKRTVNPGPATVEEKLDLILKRLDELEKRLDRLEKKKE